MTQPATAPSRASALAGPEAPLLAAQPGAATLDRIAHVQLRSIMLPLATAISDAKVLTGRQRPMREVAFLFVEITTEGGRSGIGFTYSNRAGGPGQFAHANEIADVLIGADPSDVDKIWTKLCWAGASVGRSGLATQAIAAIDTALWDLKAKRAGLPLAKLIGSHRDSVRTYNTSGGFLHTPIEEVKDLAAAALERGIGGIKLKVGQPDWRTDVARVSAVREHLDPDVPIMIDANQQWDRHTAIRMGRIFEEMNLVWIEEPLDAYDVQGHAALARSLDTPIATGEMLASVAEHVSMIDGGGVDVVQPDAPRVGGVTQYLKLAAYAEAKHLDVAPHFIMEIHCHLAAAYPKESWVEHFDWLDPLFNEHLEIRDGRMWLSKRPGLGITLSEQAHAWTVATAEAGARP